MAVGLTTRRGRTVSERLPARRKREARAVHKKSAVAQKLHGFKAKLLNKKNHTEKIQMKKT